MALQTQIQYEMDGDNVYAQWFEPDTLWLGIFNDGKHISKSKWYHGAEARDVWQQHLEHLMRRYEA